MAPSTAANTAAGTLLVPAKYSIDNFVDLLKVRVALKETGTPVQHKKSRSLALELPSGTTLHRANAILSYLYKDATAPTISDLELEATSLHPAVSMYLNSGQSDGSQVLSALLDVSKRLDALTPAAQVAIAANLHLVRDTPVSGKAQKLFQWLQSQTTVAAVAEEVTASLSTASEPNGNGSVTDNTFVRANAPILPKKGERNVLITSALPYVNNEPHLGNIIGCVLSADTYARYCRLRGDNVLYVCGTDEYGTATENKAIEEKTSCQALCDKYHKVHKDIYDYFDIDFDQFGRTATPYQTEIAQDIFLKMHKNGYLEEETMTQLYCEKCSRFLADRFVEGTCPNCKYDDARGDQCDACQKLLNAVDLINPRCKQDGNKPILRDSKHMFLQLPKLQKQLSEYISNTSVAGRWSSNALAVSNGWLKEGLKARCMTRDLKWGVPVPLEEMKGKVLYVWFDAPIGYISITAKYTKDWEAWWKAPDDVKLYQFMGKDNIPFHSILFPSYLLATHERWTMMHNISTTEYLNYENGKFSKSRKTGVFGSNVKDTGIPIAVWRYYLLANRPETNDSMFAWKDFIARNNNELLNNLGNFCNRVLKFLASPKYNSMVPEYDEDDAADATFIADVNALMGQYIEALDNTRIRQGLQIAMALSARGNQYLQENKLDNKLFSAQRQRCDTVLGLSINLVYLLSAVLYPYMPSTAASICQQLNVQQRSLKSPHLTFDIRAGHTIGTPEYLFQSIKEEMEFVYQQRYGGASAGGAAPVSSVSPSPSTGAPAAATASKSKSKSKTGGAAAQDPIRLLETYISTAGKSAVPAAVLDLQRSVEAQGLVVRQLKTDKAEAAQVQAAVAQLLQLKAQLLEDVTKLTSA
ncbi:methionine--tRNA ligase mes1 [Sorochytrium milnesiophthora]